MAEFCLECYNKVSDEHFKESDVILDMDFCEECCEMKPCIVIMRRKGFLYNWAKKLINFGFQLSFIAFVLTPKV